MLIDCSILVKFNKLRGFNLSEFYFNPCLLSILFKSQVGINNFMLFEFNTHESWDDENFIYSELKSFIPRTDQEVFLDRHFDSLNQMFDLVEVLHCQPRLVHLDPYDVVNPNEYVSLDEYKIIRKYAD